MVTNKGIECAESAGCESGKRGVAIIMVVGMLALLMLTATAFSVAMRIERRGAANYKHSIQARNMLSVGLARAMTEIDSVLDDPTDPNAFYIYPSDAPGWQGSVYVSVGPDSTDHARVMTADTLENYIPGILQPDVNAAIASGSMPSWRYVSDSTTNSTIRGRYAYMIVDCSGLLDANVLAVTNRGYGSLPSELQVIVAGGSIAGSIAQADIEAREDHIRYETMPEMKALNPNLFNAEYFYVNSLTEDGYSIEADHSAKEKINIGLDEAGLIANAPTIKAGLMEAGIHATQVDFVFESLLDYVDVDCIPRNLEAPNVEAIPMVSEVVVTSRFTMAGVDFGVSVEFMHPFLKINPNSGGFYFQGNCNGTVVLDGAPNPFSVPIPQTVIDVTSGDFIVSSAVMDFPVPLSTPPTLASVASFACTVEIEVFANLPAPPQQVDKIPILDFPATLIPIDTMITLAKDVVDPRFNWLATHWGNPVGGLPSLGTVNQKTLNYMGMTPSADVGIEMYCADTGRLRTVGELGFLLTGAANANRWRTIRLYDKFPDASPPPPNTQAHTVYDVFTCIPTVSNYRRGLVNINTPFQEVLTAIFRGASYGNPEDPGSPRLDETAALDLTDKFLEYTDIQFFRNISDIGKLRWLNMTPLLAGLTSDVRREMIIATTAGLMTTRQNLFLMIIAAESYTEGSMGGRGSKLSSMRAVAEVWRDPFRDSNGMHKMHVLSFRIIEDD